MESTERVCAKKNTLTQKITQGASKLVLASCLTMSAGTALAAPVSGSFSINQQSIDTLTDSAGQVPVQASIEQQLRYTGSGQTCSDVEWYIKLDGDTQWNNFDSTKYAELKIHRAGTHQLKMTVEGFNNWFTFCFHSGEYDERIVDLKITSPGYTQTKHPILIVPGVIAYDNIQFLFLNNEYFYGVADAIGENSDQYVSNLSLHPWKDTVPRGEDLALEILTLMANGEIPADGKVNLLAHSHGSTTARVATKLLADAFGSDGKVASLTTVAGPHYGTPTADGANIAMTEWGWQGDLLELTLVPMFEFIGDAVAYLSGHPEYSEEGMNLLEVLEDFTQDGMYEFNTAYPSVGLPTGGKYWLTNIDDPTVDVDDPTLAYGNGIYDDYAASALVDYNVEQTDGSIVNQSLVIGDGLGNVRDINDGDAVQYYSFGGNGPWNSHWADPLDLALVIFNSFYGVVYNNTLSVPSAEEFIESDSFIPVDSSKFGKYIGTYYWNHVDEQNALLGLMAGKDPMGQSVASPKDVYRIHANRLQRAGL